ncbi:hypothetical protein ABBQ38_003126 [Trebouxia sp. C0009 RCD-2024]
MTRGNQRETDRARAAKRAGGKTTAKDKDGLTALQRKESAFQTLEGLGQQLTYDQLIKQLARRDAQALQEKLAKKAQQDAADKQAGNK